MSDVNPYQVPQADLSVVNDHPHLDRIISSQKLMLLAVVSFILAVFMVPFADFNMRLPLLLTYLVIVYAAGCISYRLGVHWLMILLQSVCLCIPLVNLVLLLRINARASEVINKAGVKVGFLGAKRHHH